MRHILRKSRLCYRNLVKLKSGISSFCGTLARTWSGGHLGIHGEFPSRMKRGFDVRLDEIEGAAYCPSDCFMAEFRHYHE